MNLFYHRCRVSAFKIQSSAHKRITAIPNSKLRASAYKLYRWICFKTETWDAPKSVSAQLDDIHSATGLSKHAIINGRRALVKLGLIQEDFEGGPGGKHYLSISDAETDLKYFRWDLSPPRYFCVPVVSMFPAIFRDKWSGTDALVYDALLDRMGESGKNELPLSGLWFDDSQQKYAVRQ